MSLINQNVQRVTFIYQMPKLSIDNIDIHIQLCFL